MTTIRALKGPDWHIRKPVGTLCHGIFGTASANIDFASDRHGADCDKRMKGKTTMKKRNQGFTLVEIMIVVAIIAILAAVAIPNFVKYRKTSQAAACISNLKQIQSACEQAKLAGKSTVNDSDIIGADKYIKQSPVCPQVGSYSYTLPADDTSDPTCSVGQNSSTDTAVWHKLDRKVTE